MLARVLLARGATERDAHAGARRARALSRPAPALGPCRRRGQAPLGPVAPSPPRRRVFQRGRAGSVATVTRPPAPFQVPAAAPAGRRPALSPRVRAGGQYSDGARRPGQVSGRAPAGSRCCPCEAAAEVKQGALPIVIGPASSQTGCARPSATKRELQIQQMRTGMTARG